METPNPVEYERGVVRHRKSSNFRKHYDCSILKIHDDFMYCKCFPFLYTSIWSSEDTTFHSSKSSFNAPQTLFQILRSCSVLLLWWRSCIEINLIFLIASIWRFFWISSLLNVYFHLNKLFCLYGIVLLPVVGWSDLECKCKALVRFFPLFFNIQVLMFHLLPVIFALRTSMVYSEDLRSTWIFL